MNLRNRRASPPSDKYGRIIKKKASSPSISLVRRPATERIERTGSAAGFISYVPHYLLSREEYFQPPARICEGSEVTAKMRSILIDWLVQVHGRFDMCSEALHLAINLTDWTISQIKIDKIELQLVGVASTLIAAKFHEVDVPSLLDFEQVTDNACNRRQIVRMEMKILEICKFDLSRAHSITILHCLSKELDVGTKQHAIARYIGEVALLDHLLVKYLPSQIAAMSLFVANRMTGSDTDADMIAEMIRWNATDMKAGAHVLSQAALRLHNQEKLVAVKRKFSSAKECRASNFTEEHLSVLKNF